jgi:hypothetical protein
LKASVLDACCTYFSYLSIGLHAGSGLFGGNTDVVPISRIDLVMVCSRCEVWVHVLATGGMPMSVDHFVATGLTPVSLRPLITVGNLAAWSCLDIV